MKHDLNMLQFFASFVHLYIHLKTAHVHVACCTYKHRLKHIGIIILHNNGTCWYALQLEKKSFVFQDF